LAKNDFFIKIHPLCSKVTWLISYWGGGDSHHVFRIMYHFVWITKYRHKIFVKPQKETLKQIINKIGYDYNINIVELEIPLDHIHMVIKSEPRLYPSRIMQVVKSLSAREFFKIYPQIKKKYFWGGNLWTSGFYANTVGQYGNRDVIAKYVKNQGKYTIKSTKVN
jgi:putative transposase